MQPPYTWHHMQMASSGSWRGLPLWKPLLPNLKLSEVSEDPRKIMSIIAHLLAPLVCLHTVPVKELCAPEPHANEVEMVFNTFIHQVIYFDWQDFMLLKAIISKHHATMDGDGYAKRKKGLCIDNRARAYIPQLAQSCLICTW